MKVSEALAALRTKNANSTPGAALPPLGAGLPRAPTRQDRQSTARAKKEAAAKSRAEAEAKKARRAAISATLDELGPARR